MVGRSILRPSVQRHSPRANHAAFERFLAVAHWPSLDGLRGLAILPVIWHHATSRPLPGIAGKGAVGVDLFFALSGFLITTLLLRERRKYGRIKLGAFYARRSLRIFPLYYMVLGAHAAYALLLPESAAAAHFLRSLLYHATYTANWLVDFAVPHPVWFAFSWSLCVEEQFYWVWPVLLALITRRAALFALMAGAIGVDALAEHGAFASVAPAGSLAARVLTSFAPPIGFGSLLALLLDTRSGFALTEWVLGQRLTAPLLLAASVGLLLIPATPYLPLSLCLAALVGAVVVMPSHGLCAWLEHPALRSIGTLSYGAYLLHVSALGLLRRALPDLREQAWLVFGLGLPLSLLLAAGAHLLIERRLLALRRRLR
ncbi:MAG TPA: acyltransferase [Polyangiaceae bacterium]|nr:acyltransferase [Polyangiaceae bacterium]